MDTPTPYILIADQPACSTVLFVRGTEVTILSQGSRDYTRGFAIGLVQGREENVEHRGTVTMPAGNAAYHLTQGIVQEGRSVQ
jgi:hypothetical protein